MNPFDWEHRKDDLRDELESHLRMAIAERIRRGETPEHARAEAIREMGNLPLVADVTRQQWGWMWLERVAQDIRYALRQLRRKKLFTLTSLATLAAGMGATIAIFSVVDSLLLHPLHLSDPDHLATLRFRYRNGEGYLASAPDFRAMQREGIPAFAQVGGYEVYGDTNLTGGRIPQRLAQVGITANLLPLLGVQPQLGRNITEAEDADGGPPVLLISDRLWRGQYGADPRVLGKTILLNGEAHTVIGVLPRNFVFPDPSVEPDVYLAANFPMTTVTGNDPVRPVGILARLREGARRTQAEAQTQAFYRSRALLLPTGMSSPENISVISIEERVCGDLRRPLILLMSCVLCLLMVTCANVGGLQLARAALRAQEIAVRGALGASRGRLILQFVIENLVLSILASFLGLLIAWFSIEFLEGLQAAAIPLMATGVGDHSFTGIFGKYGSAIHINWTVVLFSIALPLATTLLFGVLPAIQASKPRKNGLAGSSAQMTPGLWQRRFGHVILVFELAASVALLFSAGLLVKSFGNLMSFASGFDANGVMTASVQLTGSSYGNTADLSQANRQAISRFTGDLSSALKALPETQEAAFTTILPLDAVASIPFSLDGDTRPSFDMGHYVAFITASPGYFDVIGTPILQGRAFTEEDRPTSPRVALVNRDLARRFFSGDALGKRIFLRDFTASARSFVWVTIVGVAEDVPRGGLMEPSKPEVYLPLSQWPQRDLQIAVRAKTAPELLASDIVREVAKADPEIPVANLETMEERIAHRVVLRKSLMMLVSCFAVLAALLSAVGVGGLFAYLVVQRTRELGIRLALGSSRLRLMRVVMGEVWMIVNGGVFLGTIAAIAAGRAIGSMLVGIGALDSQVLLEALALVVIAALIAAGLPAFRAAHTDLLAVLREE